MIQHRATPPPSSDRAPHLETLRALACIALVSYHVIGATPTSGLEVAPDHPLALLNRSFVDMRMPLFSFLSGCVFVCLERLTRRPEALVLSKMRRLLIPMVSVGLLFWALRAAMGHAQEPLWWLFVMPYAHFWFLQATFLIMACFLLLSALLPVHSTTLATGLLVLGALSWTTSSVPPVDLFSVIQMMYLLPFFMLGYLCSHSRVLGKIRLYMGRKQALMLVTCLVGLGFVLALGPVVAEPPVWRRVVTVALGLSFCLSMLILAPVHRGLARLGGYSYTIYLFHVFFTAGTQMVLLQTVPELPLVLNWLIGLAAGLAGPVMLHQGLSRAGLLSALFLGTRPRALLRGRVAQTARAPNAAIRSS